MIEIALKFLEKGFSVIPVDENKQPLCDWSKYQKKPMSNFEAKKLFRNAWGIALICYNQLEVLDFDLKYDLTGRLWYEYMEQVPQELRSKLLVNKTMNGGYHILYLCDKTENNLKLAQRASTAEEKHVTYLRNYLNDSTREKSLKIASQDLIRVLIETRGGKDGVGGGYVLIPPTEGYERVEGKLGKITPEERDFLHNLAKSFDTYTDLRASNLKRPDANKYKEKIDNPFDDYNNKTDILDLMTGYGWTVVGETNSLLRLKRPGDTKSKSSAAIFKNNNIIKVFSTSHVLYNGDTGCSPSKVFIELECNGDTKLAYKQLVNLGYGDEQTVDG